MRWRDPWKKRSFYFVCLNLICLFWKAVEYDGYWKSAGKVQGNWENGNRDVCRMFYGGRVLPIGNWGNEQMTIEGSWKHSKMPRMPDFGVPHGFHPLYNEVPPTYHHHHLYNIEQHNATTRKMSTELANIAGKLVRSSQRLRERYREEMEKRGR